MTYHCYNKGNKNLLTVITLCLPKLTKLSLTDKLHAHMMTCMAHRYMQKSDNFFTLMHIRHLAPFANLPRLPQSLSVSSASSLEVSPPPPRLRYHNHIICKQYISLEILLLLSHWYNYFVSCSGSVSCSVTRHSHCISPTSNLYSLVLCRPYLCPV